MGRVKSVKIDGESIHIYSSAIYIFEASKGFTLEVNLIVSEITIKRYRKEDSHIIEIELEDGRMINTFMFIKAMPGGLPQLHLFCDLNDVHEYEDFDHVHENDAWFPNIEEGITLEDIRKVEMPFEDITLKLKLPIDQVEWLKQLKKKELSALMAEFIKQNRIIH